MAKPDKAVPKKSAGSGKSVTPARRKPTSRTPKQREKLRRDIQKHKKAGMSLRAIGKAVGVAKSTVTHHINQSAKGAQVSTRKKTERLRERKSGWKKKKAEVLAMNERQKKEGTGDGRRHYASDRWNTTKNKWDYGKYKK